MRFIVNGEIHEHHGDGSLDSLLRELRVNQDGVVTVLNDDIVGKQQRNVTALKNRDRVELLVFAGGG